MPGIRGAEQGAAILPENNPGTTKYKLIISHFKYLYKAWLYT